MLDWALFEDVIHFNCDKQEGEKNRQGRQEPYIKKGAKQKRFPTCGSPALFLNFWSCSTLADKRKEGMKVKRVPKKERP